MYACVSMYVSMYAVSKSHWNSVPVGNALLCTGGPMKYAKHLHRNNKEPLGVSAPNAHRVTLCAFVPSI